MRAYCGVNEDVRRMWRAVAASYASATVFRCLLLIWSVEMGLRERVVGRMRT